MTDRIGMPDLSGRVPVRIHGGPFDRGILFAPACLTEFRLVADGREHAYEIKGRWASYLGPRPIEEDG